MGIQPRTRRSATASDPFDALPRWLGVERAFGVIDAALVAVAALMVVANQTVLLFHLIFVLLTLGAFYWRFRAFAVKLLIWATVASASVLWAVVGGETQGQELIEIPLLTTIILLVFVIAGQRAKVQAELAHLSLHDALTSLPNRTLFLSRLHEAFAIGARHQAVAVLYVDLDGFKAVNDRLGHAAGDRLLVEVAARLRSCVRPDIDTVARLGGDEFTVLLRDASPNQAQRVAARILAAVGAPFAFGDERVVVTPSVGIALSIPPATDPPEALLRHADAAMYQAKLGGKARYQLY